MTTTVTFSDVSGDEAAGMALRLAEAKGALPDDAEVQACDGYEALCALFIAREVAAYAARAYDARVAALRERGEIYAQLPAADQQYLDQQLVERARAAGVDTSAIEG